MLGILSKAPGGAIPVISGSTTYLGLTRSGPGVGPGEPASFYGGGARNFVRIVPADDVQGAAVATYLKDHGKQRAYVLTDKDPYGIGIGEAFSFAARKLGATLAGSTQWNAKAKDILTRFVMPSLRKCRTHYAESIQPPTVEVK